MTPWQKAPPREPGWYWWRVGEYQGISNVEFCKHDVRPYVWLHGERKIVDTSWACEWGQRVLPPGEEPVPCKPMDRERLLHGQWGGETVYREDLQPDEDDDK